MSLEQCLSYSIISPCVMGKESSAPRAGVCGKGSKLLLKNNCAYVTKISYKALIILNQALNIGHLNNHMPRLFQT